MSIHQRYQTRPLESWRRVKELQSGYFQRMARAREEGKLLASGAGTQFTSIFAGIEGCEYLETGAYGFALGRNPELAIQCANAVEARGFASDLCGPTRLAWGAAFLECGPYGAIPPPDFAVQTVFCEALGKGAQITCEHYGIPCFIIDYPLAPRLGREEVHLEYLASQIMDAIEWMERVSGKEFNDERFIEAAGYEFQSTQLWAKMCRYNQAIPAPLDQRLLYTLFVPASTERHKHYTAEFYRMLVDELEERVNNQIAALATERCRLLHEGYPPFFFFDIFRIPEKYGALFIGSHFDFTLPGGFEAGEDGSLVVRQTPKERGRELRTREDTVRALAEWYLPSPGPLGYIVSSRVNEIAKLADDWHADGVVIHFNRGCPGGSAGGAEVNLALREKGIPTMIYEANFVDPREFAEFQVVDRIEAFLESLGLEKLVD